jgi:hypothetical protein
MAASVLRSERNNMPPGLLHVIVQGFALLFFGSVIIGWLADRLNG